MVDVRSVIGYPYSVLRTGRLFVPTLLAVAVPFLLVKAAVLAGGERVTPYRPALTTVLVLLGLTYFAGIQVRVYRHVLARDASRVSLSDRNGIRSDALALAPLVLLGFAVPVYVAAAAGLGSGGHLAAVARGEWRSIVPLGSRDPVLFAGLAVALVTGYLLPAAQGGVAEGARLNGRFVERRLGNVVRSPQYAASWLLAVVLTAVGVALVGGLLTVVPPLLPRGVWSIAVPVLALLAVLPATYFFTAASAIAARGYASGREREDREPAEQNTAWGEP